MLALSNVEMMKLRIEEVKRRLEQRGLSWILLYQASL